MLRISFSSKNHSDHSVHKVESSNWPIVIIGLVCAQVVVALAIVVWCKWMRRPQQGLLTAPLQPPMPASFSVPVFVPNPVYNNPNLPECTPAPTLKSEDDGYTTKKA